MNINTLGRIALVMQAVVMTAICHADTTVIKSSKMIDGISSRTLVNKALVIENGRIRDIVAHDNIPADVRVIDLGEATILPGMIDAHVHPLIYSDDYQTEHIKKSSAYKALRGLQAVQAHLQAGWTTMRVAGDADVAYAMVEVKRAIEEGYFVGPRIVGAAHYISITGGGGDVNYIAPEQHVIADGLVVDGVDEMRRAIRNEVKFGSEWIKLMVTGAFMSAGDSPNDVHLSPEELAAAMSEAKRLSTPVMAHAHAADGIKQAVLAGARSIEHGSFIDDEGIRLMKKHGTYLIPTMYIGDYYIDEQPDSEAQAKMVELSRATRADFFSRIGKAIKAGVKVGVGSDFGGYDATINAREFDTLIEAGMTPMQAIQAGTIVNAQLLMMEEDIGSLQIGKLADVIAVSKNPITDISELERVIFVMKEGQVVVAP